MKGGINRLTVPADLEMNRSVRTSGQDLTLPDALTLLHEGRPQTGVGGHPSALMPDQDQISEASQIVAGIGHLARGGGNNLSARRNREIQSFIEGAVRAQTESRDDLSGSRPDKGGPGSGGGWSGWRTRARRPA